jgi:hypothetical protein
MAGLVDIGRVAALTCATLTCGLAACSYLPDMSQVRAPSMDLHTFEMRDWNSYAKSQTATRAVTPNDLVDPGGRCAAMAPPVQTTPDPSLGQAPTAQVAPPTRGVGLDMTECEVATAIGAQPQSVDIGTNERGERNVILTYVGTDRSGIYHFVGGRLVSLERGPDYQPPVQAQKKPTKKQAKQPKPQPAT